MPVPPRIYIDFNDMLGPNSFVLSCRGAVEDIARQNLILIEGMRIEVHDGELLASGTVGKTKALQGWPGADQWMIDVDPDSWREVGTSGSNFDKI